MVPPVPDWLVRAARNGLAAAAAVEGTKGLAETAQEMKGQAQQAGQSAADAGEKFVTDFVAAWTKVMNLDRFDL